MFTILLLFPQNASFAPILHHVIIFINLFVFDAISHYCPGYFLRYPIVVRNS